MINEALAHIRGPGINVIWPNLLIDKHASMTWFTLFRDRPLVFHAFQYALAIHHDLLCNHISWSRTPQVISHKARTLALLNQTLSHLSNENIELAILAVLVLAANELKPERLLSDTVLLFDPHLPGANWNSVYSRMEQVSRSWGGLVDPVTPPTCGRVYSIAGPSARKGHAPSHSATRWVAPDRAGRACGRIGFVSILTRSKLNS